MNYLSFDIGIKNLAYCILTPEKNIVEWDVINLNENPICETHLRKKCEKQSSHFRIDKETGITHYYCSAHSKKHKQCKKLNSNYDIFQLSKTCIKKLSAIDLSSVKVVLLENQPALKNPTMKSIQMIVYSFFMMKGVLDESFPVCEIHMVNARNKLKVYKGPPIECQIKEKYKKNKFLSVEYTGKMIESENSCFQEKFKNSKKKDDLADAYLQGIYWIEK